MKCELDVKQNPCEFLDPNTKECSNPKHCSFQEQPPKPEPVPEPKPEKWFEKYTRAREMRYAKELAQQKKYKD